jgi:hypothetical protein
MSRKVSNILLPVLLGILVLSMTAACSVAHTTTQSPRTAVEQLLLTEATERSLGHTDLPPLPIPQRTAVSLDVTGLTTFSHKSDLNMLRRIIAGWLGEQGFLVRESKENAIYRLEIITQALGTEYSQTFFGMPAFQSVLIPFALPELTLYKAQYETGYARFYVNIVENSTDRFISSTPIYTGETYYNSYTLLFLFTWHSSDLVASPQVGSFHDPVDSGHESPSHSTTID